MHEKPCHHITTLERGSQYLYGTIHKPLPAKHITTLKGIAMLHSLHWCIALEEIMTKSLNKKRTAIDFIRLIFYFNKLKAILNFKKTSRSPWDGLMHHG